MNIYIEKEVDKEITTLRLYEHVESEGEVGFYNKIGVLMYKEGFVIGCFNCDYVVIECKETGRLFINFIEEYLSAHGAERITWLKPGEKVTD